MGRLSRLDTVVLGDEEWPQDHSLKTNRDTDKTSGNRIAAQVPIRHKHCEQRKQES